MRSGTRKQDRLPFTTSKTSLCIPHARSGAGDLHAPRVRPLAYLSALPYVATDCFAAPCRDGRLHAEAAA